MYDYDKHDDCEVALCKCGKIGDYDVCPYDQEIRGIDVECECCEDCRNLCCQEI